MDVFAGMVLVVGLIAALTVIIHVSHQNLGASRERQVLPSHYSSLLESDPFHYPGYCPSCDSDNEPGYRLCENCGQEIPTVQGHTTRTDVGHIFNE